MNDKELRKRILRELYFSLKEDDDKEEKEEEKKEDGNLPSHASYEETNAKSDEYSKLSVPKTPDPTGYGWTAAAAGGGLLAGAGAGAALGASAGTATFPLIGTAIGAAGGAALGLIGGLFFRSAGFMEVKQDIKEANTITDDDLSAKLHTGKYIDLTTWSDDTDEGDLTQFMAALSNAMEAYENPKDESHSNSTNKLLRDNEEVFNKICGAQYILINETGFNDRVYYVKCAKLTTSIINSQGNCDTTIMNFPKDVYKMYSQNQIENLMAPLPEYIQGVTNIESPFTKQKCSPVTANESKLFLPRNSAEKWVDKKKITESKKTYNKLLNAFKK